MGFDISSYPIEFVIKDVQSKKTFNDKSSFYISQDDDQKIDFFQPGGLMNFSLYLKDEQGGIFILDKSQLQNYPKNIKDYISNIKIKIHSINDLKFSSQTQYSYLDFDQITMNFPISFKILTNS